MYEYKRQKKKAGDSRAVRISHPVNQSASAPLAALGLIVEAGCAELLSRLQTFIDALLVLDAAEDLHFLQLQIFALQAGKDIGAASKSPSQFAQVATELFGREHQSDLARTESGRLLESQ